VGLYTPNSAVGIGASKASVAPASSEAQSSASPMELEITRVEAYVRRVSVAAFTPVDLR
jgi:hypothetical protein